MKTRGSGTEDRRIQRTRRALSEALIALILERGWEGFSIQDLCERADVGRSTFYTHFADKEDVVEAGLADFRRALRAQLSGTSGARRPLDFSRGLLEHAHDHQRLFRALVGKRSGHLVQRKFHDLVTGLIREDLSPLIAAGPRRDGAVAFLSGAFVDLMVWSLEARSPGPPEEVDRFFQELAGAALAAVPARPPPAS